MFTEPLPEVPRDVEGIVYVSTGHSSVSEPSQRPVRAHWEGEVDGVPRFTVVREFESVEHAVTWGRAAAPRVVVTVAGSEFSAGEDDVDGIPEWPPAT